MAISPDFDASICLDDRGVGCIRLVVTLIRTLGVGSFSLGEKFNGVRDIVRENRLPTPRRTMPQLLASLFLHHEPAPIDYNSAMVSFKI